jgi:hypothetical protein
MLSMFKTTADSQADRTRTASHATKPFANGRIDVLPPWAKPQEELYQSLKTQMQSMLDQRKHIEEEARYINERLKFTVPYEEWQRLTERRNLLTRQLDLVQEACIPLRTIARRVGEHTWLEAFFACAKTMLPDAMIKELLQTTDEIMGRRTFEIRPGSHEKTEHAKQTKRDAENRRDKRQRYANTKERLVQASRTNHPVGSFPPYYKTPKQP